MMQTIDSTFIDAILAPEVKISGVTNSINGGDNLFLGSLNEPGNSSSTTITAIEIINDSTTNAVDSVIAVKLSVPVETTTPFTMSTSGGIMSATTNSTATGTDAVPMTAQVAMFVGEFMEKNPASTSVGDINTTTNLNATSPVVLKLSKSQKQAAKRKPSSPPEGANVKTRTTGLSTDTFSVVPNYDIDFPVSPTCSVTTQKVVTKEKVTSNTTIATTTPAFVLQGKAVPNTSATGSFNF